MRLLPSVLGLGLLCALWSAPGSAANDEPLYVFVHPQTPIERLSAYEVEAVFTRQQTRWDDGNTVLPFSLPGGSSVRDIFDRAVLRLTPDQVGRFWLDRRVRGLGMPPRQVPSASMMLKVVASLRGSIGYAPVSSGRLGVKVVARVVQGKVVSP